MTPDNKPSQSRTNWLAKRTHATPIHRRVEDGCKARCAEIGRTWLRLPDVDRARILTKVLRSLPLKDLAKWKTSFDLGDVLNVQSTPRIGENKSRRSSRERDSYIAEMEVSESW